MGIFQTGVEQYLPSNLIHRQVPKPSHRHAAPAGPWPYVDNLEEQEDTVNIDSKKPPKIGSCEHQPPAGPGCDVCRNWIYYPQSQFGNWTKKLVEKCGIYDAVANKDHSSTIHRVDVMEDGTFVSGERTVNSENKREYWTTVLEKKREPGIRVRALFVDKISGPVLQMLGSAYNIEPFFFSSSINWIPSRFQENPIPKVGDHITVTLTYVRSMDVKAAKAAIGDGSSLRPTMSYLTNQFVEVDHIDTQAPLLLRSSSSMPNAVLNPFQVSSPLGITEDLSESKILLLDLIGIHMVRNVDGSTVISFHHDIDGSTTAVDLFTRLKLVGRSVYWQILVKTTKDPTFMFLAILWSALYAWDKALEELYEYFCTLESKVIVTNDVAMTYELHVIRAHLLHYVGLLTDFEKSVKFIRDTDNPAMEADSISVDDRKTSRRLLEKECDHLLTEIHRLQMNRKMQDDRVQNVTQLVYAMVNIGDSKAMKRLSYVTMIFLPASFMAGVFGMNVRELTKDTYGTIRHYVEAALPLTFVTIWIIVAFQSRFVLREEGAVWWKKLLWPLAYLQEMWPRVRSRNRPHFGPADNA